MITNLEEKLVGLEPINRIELIELINSYGRTYDFETNDNIEIYKSEPKECYDLSTLSV